jgi:hypothetical protein
MNNILEVFKNINSNGWRRDIMYVVYGYIILIILDFLFNFNNTFYPNWTNYNQYAKALAIITLAYLIARIFNEIGVGVKGFIYFILSNDKISKIKVYLSNLIDFINLKPHPVTKTADISHSHLEHFISESSGLSFLFDREIQLSIMENVYLGFTFTLGLFYNPFLFLISFIFLYFSIKTDLKIWDLKKDTAQFLFNLDKQNK